MTKRINMTNWVKEIIETPVKKAMPILSFPAVQLMNITVKDLISDSGLQSKAMHKIAQRTDAAASVSLMDLSVEAEAFGAKIRFSDEEVPTVIENVVSSMEEIEDLKVPKIGAGRTGLYIEAMKKACLLIEDRPVFAGVIGPYSLAGRLMDISEIMVFCYDEPDAANLLLNKATDFIIEYCKAYKAVGANGVVIAEPLTGMLSPAMAEEFSAPFVRKIVEAVQDEEFIVIYHNCGNNTVRMTKSIISTGAAGYHFGNAIKMSDILPLMPKDVLVMGNVDPAGELKNGTCESVRKATLEIMNECCKYRNFVISSGCDIPPLANWENIDAFFEAVEEFYA